MSERIDKSTVKKVAKLSRLDLTDEEVNEFAGQLSAVLDYVEKMNELDTDNVEPLAHCLPVNNCFREDVVGESLGTEKTMVNAPDSDSEFFKVPKILDDSSVA
ncbi:MAG: Asp-tRNA(Asn)/Glu-tRNA(Gln) amidotransferase subunit GatC [Planctomycetota bacterium]|jgi:aspartyl-tRNA(Asn)/glutamyl-tRNA(Gln) amidotransferase subunit C